MRHPDGGCYRGPVEAGQIRFRAAEMFAMGITPPEMARLLRVMRCGCARWRLGSPRSWGRSRSEPVADDCVVPAGVYLVGPGHHLVLRQVAEPVWFDRYAVTVRRYDEFLAAVERHGSARWDHPEPPTEVDHQPWQERLRIPEYCTVALAAPLHHP